MNRFHLAYAHLILSTEDDLRHGAVPVSLLRLRHEFHGPLIIANGFTYATAMQVLEEDLADAAAFEQLLVANPDSPNRFRLKAPLNPPDEPTFYGGAENGYPDYSPRDPRFVQR